MTSTFPATFADDASRCPPLLLLLLVLFVCATATATTALDTWLGIAQWTPAIHGSWRHLGTDSLEIRVDAAPFFTGVTLVRLGGASAERHR